MELKANRIGDLVRRHITERRQLRSLFGDGPTADCASSLLLGLCAHGGRAAMSELLVDSGVSRETASECVQILFDMQIFNIVDGLVELTPLALQRILEIFSLPQGDAHEQ